MRPQAFEVIEAERARFPVNVMCRALGVSRSGYYAWRARGPSQRAKQNAKLCSKIIDIHKRSRGTYGSPRVTAQLHDEGFVANRKRVARLMAQMGLSGELKPKFKNANSQPSNTMSPNILDRNFKTEQPDQVWVSDITYIPTAAGWLYLAVVIDLFSRRVVGWAMAEHMRAELVVDALAGALGSRVPSQRGLVFHSDQGSQYSSERVREALSKEKIVSSMSRRGNCWDNAVAEAFFATLKRELVYRRIYLTPAEATTSIAEWIEVFYNRQRRHSTIGYQSPAQYEEDFYARTEAMSQAA